MAPGGGGKRKRGDRNFSNDDRHNASRPSPHRPESLNLAQQSPSPQQNSFNREQYDQRGGARRRGSRGGRGGGPQRSPMNSSNAPPVQFRPTNPPLKQMSSPPAPAATQVEPAPEPAPQPSPAKSSVPTSATNTSLVSSSVQNQLSLPQYHYDYINDERLHTWADKGRKAVVDCGVQACIDKDPLVLGLLFQEVLRSGIDKRLEPTDAGSLIKEILERDATSHGSPNAMVDHTSFDASSLFLDCLSIITELSGPNSALQSLVLATGVSPHLMRCELDSVLLESLGLIRNTFVRVGIRQQTNLLYRQSNYNLLREETEGYSKLVTELFTTSSSEPLTSEVVEETFERVKGMIGAYDLDVGRVLDITLDVFAAVLVKQYRFFVKYLRASSWWPQDRTFKGALNGLAPTALPKWALPGSSGRPISDEEREELARTRDERDKLFWQRTREIGMAAFFEIGGRRAEAEVAVTANKNVSDLPQSDEDQKWIEATGTLPPPGNKVAAQVLGFKLRFYSSSARDPSDVLPVNLIYLAALLIKVGFISLRDLYPHLWPADEAMEAVRVEKMKEKAEREKLNRPGGGTMNALMTAPALIDDTPPGKLREIERSREAEKVRALEAARSNSVKMDTAKESTPAPVPPEEKEELPEPADQKVQLLKSLLCIGAIPESLYMLGRFPWLPDAFPDLPEHIHRILHHCISKVYEPLRPLTERADLREQQKVPDPDQSSAAKGQIKFADTPPRKIMRWAQLDKDDTNEGIDYRFYWDDWADNVPVCQSVDDVFLLCSTLLNYTGVKIGQDTALLLKLSRIGSHSLATNPSETNMSRWIDLSKRLIVPALSLTKCNPGVVNEVFELIKNFSTTTRYSIYAEWYLGQISRLPDMKVAFDLARAETRDVLKRISKTSVKPMARALAKVAYASPGIVFQVALAQIESYDNLVETVVECARYFTYLGYDVLTWSLMSSLGGRGRTRVQADGMLTSRWLATLSLFAGRVFKRYSVMNPAPILQYVAEQLRIGNSTDLIILGEITNSMAGIVSETLFNDAQVLSMAGGDLLQTQTMLQLLDRRHESKITARRLVRSLTEPKLAGQILISIAHERQTCIFKIPEEDAHVKLLGNLFDELHRILTQYLDLLRSNLSIRDFNSLVPGVSQLINDFGIEPSVAFWTSRPSISAAMVEYDASNPKLNLDQRKTPVKEVTDDPVPKLENCVSDVDANLGEATEMLEEAQGSPSVPLVNGISHGDGVDVEMKDVAPATDIAPPPVTTQSDVMNEPWHPVLRKIMDEIRPALPDETWEILSRPFYVTFWQLSLRDMLVPTQSYEDEINRQKKKILTINSDRSDISILGTQKKDREKKAINELQDRLRAELKDHVQVYQQNRSRLGKEKEHWFSGSWGKWDALNIALIEHCFFPRILISPVDAMYTFKMLKFLHSSGATNFRTMGVLDQLFKEKRLTSMLFLCTAKEAENFGRFLNEVIKDLAKWHSDRNVYEKEAFGTKKDLPGFCRKMTNEKSILLFWDYEEFRRVVYKWHRNLNTALKTCISSGEYMHIRNAINILKAVHQHFPAVNWMGQSQVTSITELSRSESRDDLKIAATSLLGNLKRREKDWVIPQAFQCSEAVPNGTTVRTGSAKPATPQPESDSTKNLNPKAPEFQPSPRPSINGAPKAAKTTSGRLEVEDGEIEDAKMSDTAIKGTVANIAEHHVQPVSVDTTEQASTSMQPAAPPDPRPSIPSQAITPSESLLVSITKQTRSQGPDTKPSPSAPISYPPIPPRPEVGRSVSDSVNGRLPHTLPTRPEAPLVRPTEHRMPERPNDPTLRDHGRDSRFPERGRVDKPGDILRDKVPERHASGPYSRDYERSNERHNIGDRGRVDQGWKGEKDLSGQPGLDNGHAQLHSRDPGPLSRDRPERPYRDRPYPEDHHSARYSDTQGPSARENAMAPPRSTIPQHPDRVALIQGNHDLDRTPSSSRHSDRRLERHENYPSTERSSRGPSPSRTDDRRQTRQDTHRDGRPPPDGRRGAVDLTNSHPSRYDDSHLPTGPRTDRPSGVGQNDRFEESNKIASAALPTHDPNHGRLNHESSHNNRQSEQYGRLNPGPDVSSSSRMSNGNHAPSIRGASRNVSAPQPHTTSHNSISSTDVQEKQAPTGPASNRGPPNRGPTRNSAPFTRPDYVQPSAPLTPVTETPDTAGIHPDRLKAIQGPGSAVSTNSSYDQNAGRASRPNLPPVAVPVPTGPRGSNSQLPSPMAPSPGSRGPPTGPAFANERNRGDKRFAGLQNMLQQAGTPNGPERSGQGASIRGRGGRANNVGPPASHSGPPTPSGARLDPFPPTRADLFAGRSSGPPTPQHGEEDGGYGRDGRREGAHDHARDGERRSERHRGNGSHSRDMPPELPMPPREEERPPRRENLRERPRGGEHPNERDMRRPIRDDPGRERRADSDRRSMNDWEANERHGAQFDRRDERERREGGSIGRKRGRGGEEMPVDRSHQDSKRPRRMQ